MNFDRHNLQPEDAGGMIDGSMDDTYIDHLNSALDWSEREITRLMAENVKLRELVNAVNEFVEDTHCEDCPCRRDCDDNNRIFCANNFSYHAFVAMRELGFEMPDERA